VFIILDAKITGVYSLRKIPQAGSPHYKKIVGYKPISAEKQFPIA
jgi:hypothetical protein